MASFKDFQLLVYTDTGHYEACKAFYQYVLSLNPFYGWDNGITDRGLKYRIAGGVLVLLCQEDPFPEYGPVHFQLQVDDLDAFYERVKDICALEITMKPFVRPYGWKMFRMKDPAGNHINIYEIPEACRILKSSCSLRNSCFYLFYSDLEICQSVCRSAFL